MHRSWMSKNSGKSSNITTTRRKKKLPRKTNPFAGAPMNFVVKSTPNVKSTRFL